MSRTYHHGKHRKPRIKSRTTKQRRPDLRYLGRTLLELADAELEKEAERDYRRKAKKTKGGRS